MVAARLPRSWSAALDQLRRDVVFVRGRLAGEKPSPVIRGVRQRAGEVELAAVPRAAATPREVVVAKVVRESPDVVTLVLEDPDGATFVFSPGQFFTVLTAIGGETVPRNYSASNTPGSRELHLTIKRKAGGRVSGVLFGSRPGDRLRVLGPFGAFVTPPATGPRRLVLLGGGVGVTPLAAILRAVLASEPDAEVALVYGNRREEDIVFAGELDALAREHRGRFTLVHVLEHPGEGWDGEIGRLDRATTGRVLDALPIAAAAGAEFFVCGPDGMQAEVLAALAERGVPAAAVRLERFAVGPRPSAGAAPSTAAGSRTIAIRVGDRTHRAVALAGATLLEAGLAAGAPMPSSCGVGGCGACRVRLVMGEVEMEEPHCLSDAERAAGLVLACVGRPTGACAIEVPAELSPEDKR